MQKESGRKAKKKTGGNLLSFIFAFFFITSLLVEHVLVIIRL